MDYPDAIDLGFLYFIGTLHRWWLDPVMRGLTNLGDSALLVPVMVAVAAFLGVMGRRTSMLVMLLAPLVAWGVEWSVKRVVRRERPDVVWRLEGKPSGPSFPSGHATRSMSVYALAGMLLARLLPRGGRRWAVGCGVGLGVLVGMTRPYLGVHWPTDVLAGWALGLGCALVAANVAEVAETREQERARTEA